MALPRFLRALLVLAAWACAQEDDIHDGCIHLQVVHSTNANVFKRAVQFNLANRSDVAYYAKLSLGTPPQPQFVQLDTGSFELWVNPQCNNLPLGDSTFCESVGFFETSQSSTFSSLGTSKQLRYGIGTANITYVKDDITLPGSNAVLRQLQFGVATATTDEFSGILGIGYGMGMTTKYPNFLDEMARQNVTKVKAFTLALGPKSDQEGVIVFGGVDTSKFAGALTRLPITPAASSPDGVPLYWVAMQSLALTPPSGRRKQYDNSSMQVFLDSGSTLTLLPDGLVRAVAADFGSSTPDGNGFFPVDCDLAGVNGTLDFAFNGVTVKVPYVELIRPSGAGCVLGLQGNSQFVLLGDTFMRSAYAVFDLETNNVWMSQYQNCGSSPAALASASSLATLTGRCTAQRAVSEGSAEGPGAPGVTGGGGSTGPGGAGVDNGGAPGAPGANSAPRWGRAAGAAACWVAAAIALASWAI